ncbi:MAG: class I SAM-dependent methyltransferase [Synechococcus sp.]
MQRIPEPELMNGQEQALAYAAADFSAGDQALIDRLQGLFPAGLGDRIVDLGCGPGNISFRLARQFSQASVVGFDGAPVMLALAEDGLASSPDLNTRLSFRHVVLPSRSLAADFSAVISNSLLHHLHDPAVLWQSVRALGQSGAAVYIKDLRRPESTDQVLALKARYLADAPEVLQHDYVASLHAAFTPTEVDKQLQDAGLADQLAVRPVDDRYLEIWGHLL